MTNFGTSVFKALLKEIAHHKPNQYTNKKNVIQSSVGMIFKLHLDQQYSCYEDIVKQNVNYKKIELLFTQRASYQKDQNSNNVVFPGGQCDLQETDLQACKRQLFQQIGLKVDEQCIYLGQIPKNFYYLQKRGNKVYISCHLWCIKQNYLNWKEKLNPDQLKDSKWVQFSNLIDNSKYIISNGLKLGLIERMALKNKIAANISKNVIKVQLPELDLGMDRNLWGLTLWLWQYSLQMAKQNLISNIEPNINQEQLHILSKQIDHMKLLTVHFRDYYILKYPVILMIKYWHYMNRIRPFTYQRKPQSIKKRSVIGILAILLTAIVIYLVFT